MRGVKRAIISVLAVCFTTCAVAGTATLAFAEEVNYYVCFSNQNYAVRNSNKLTESAGEYVLSNVSLSSVIDFYVTDGEGTRWYGADNKPLSVDEVGLYRYDILFSPNTVYEDTGCKISYRFYQPSAYNVQIDGEETALNFNPYYTAYDLYYISSVYISAGKTVSYEDEEHTISESGYYRILFTPERRVNGNDYMFDEDGNYGSGEDFKYNLCIEDAPQYYAVFDVELKTVAEADAEIQGKDAYHMTRYEDNVLAAEYRTCEFFAPERDYSVKYRVYEETASGTYILIDDDNNEDTAFSKLTAGDVGWYTLSTVDGGDTYISSLRGEERKFNCFYLASEENGYGFDGEGNVDLYDDFRFAEVEEGDEDYNEDYEQYILYLTVTEAQLKKGDYEFFITDGKTKYADGAEYIAVSTAGKYKILFSDEHNYGRGRNYKYVLEEENKDKTELLIGTADEFMEFAENCSKSADYSVNLVVYLTGDIDFTGVTFKPVKSFSGTFYGGYHALKNIKYSQDGKKATVFETVTHDGVIERLKAEHLELGGKESDYVGFIGTNYGKVRHVTVSGNLTGRNYVGGVVAYNGRSDTQTGNSSDLINRASIENCTSTAHVGGESYVGGICGQNMGEVISCKAEELSATAGVKKHSTARVETVGGIAGYSLGKIYGCENLGAVTADEGRYVGGIVGLCAGEVYYSFNRGEVSGETYVGGIVGYYGMRQNNDDGLGSIAGSGSQESDAVGSVNLLNYTANYGAVTANGYAGGIVGNVGGLSNNSVAVRTLKIYNSASVGDVTVTAGNYAGGIVGSGSNAEIRSCATAGTVQAKGLGGGNYVGGIVGNGGSVYYSMSACTVKGENYLGGIAGYATSALTGCYTNVLLLPSDGAENIGAIAGFASRFNGASNEFTGVEGNYYVEGNGGIGGVDYGEKFDYAGAKIDAEVLSAGGTLSPLLCEQFSREYWQSGNGNYPTLRTFDEVEDCDEFGDEKLWNWLFDEYVKAFRALTEDTARLTYIVTFLEWNKDNGDLYDDGEILYDNFEIIRSVRVAKGESVDVPTLKFAEAKENGLFVYDGGDARYFVSFPEITAVVGNTTVYAEYCEIATTVASAENTVLCEGEFYKGTAVEVVQIGEYFTLRFTYDGKEIAVGKITVKYYVGEKAEKYRVTTADGESVNSTVSGKYVSFEFADGDYFTVSAKTGEQLPFWVALLISLGGIAVGVGCASIVWVIYKKWQKKHALQEN